MPPRLLAGATSSGQISLATGRPSPAATPPTACGRRLDRGRLKDLSPGADGRLYLRDDPGCFGVRVGPQGIRGALLILQAICIEAERRGWSMARARADGYSRMSSAGIRIGRHTYPVTIEERTTSIPPSEEDVRRWQSKKSRWETRDSPPASRSPSGRLVLHTPTAGWLPRQVG